MIIRKIRQGVNQDGFDEFKKLRLTNYQSCSGNEFDQPPNHINLCERFHKSIFSKVDHKPQSGSRRSSRKRQSKIKLEEKHS
jgi:hypothetical protein